jgi:phosphohistidine phosphatase SixA
MDLYIIRHADAVPRGTPEFEDDASRPLTDVGRDQARLLGALFARLGLHPGAVVTSPLVRARETTDELIAQLPEPRPVVEVFDEIGDKMRPKRVVRYLEKLGQPSVAVVGHEPTLSQFLAWLIGSKKAQVGFDKAGVAHVAWESAVKGGGTLRWLLTPELFPTSDGATP